MRSLQEVVEINPGNWPAMWLLGKICQRLEQFETGLKWLSRAHKVKPVPDKGRETQFPEGNDPKMLSRI